MPYVCQFGDITHKVVIVITPLTGGDSIGVCEEDLPIAATMLLADVLGADVEKLYEAITAELTRQATEIAAANQAIADSAAGRRTRHKAGSSTVRGKAAGTRSTAPDSAEGGHPADAAGAAQDAASDPQTPG